MKLMTCQMMIREVYWSNMLDNDAVDAEKKHHVNHCFDYIRQAIMCAGDMSIEGVVPGLTQDVSGYGFQHQCKSYVSVLDQALHQYHA